MTEKLIELKKRIETFRSNFSIKEEIIEFEENQFDKIIGMLFDLIVRIIKPIVKVIFKAIMKFIDKFSEYISEQSKLQKKVFKQEEILAENTKFNHELSLQIKELHDKIDNLVSKNSINLIDDQIKKIDNKTSYGENRKESKSENKNEIKFYQNENLRISNELYESKTKFEIIKKEMEKFQKQRSNLINKINSINDAVEDSNIVTSVFENNHIQDKIKVIDNNKNQKSTNLDIDTEIKNIFVKS